LSTEPVSSAPVRHFKSIDSTNLEASRLVEQGVNGPLWIIADEQTAGRGRLGRTWHSVTGNLYSTFLFQPHSKPEVMPQVGFVTALAVAQVVDELAGRALAKLKWPNDCLVNGAKIAGILCDVLDRGHIAMGCGINVASAPHGLSYPATTVSAAMGHPVTLDQVCKAYKNALSELLEEWNAGAGFSVIAERWRARAIGIGEAVSIAQDGETISGLMQGIDGDGALHLKLADQSQRRFFAGDLQIPSLTAMRSVR
jgi:BirA family transcriptional regulator, biotin operon repressor / biotin---[acetyl-CoA-carboxylase] ligase